MEQSSGPMDDLRPFLGVWTWNVKTGIVVACRDVCEYVNIPAEMGIHGVPAERFMAAIHPDDRDELKRRVDEVLEGVDILVADYRIRSARYGTVWVRSSGHCFRDKGGNPSHLSGYLTRIEKEASPEADEKAIHTAIVRHLMDAREASTKLSRPTLTKLITAALLEASAELANRLKRD